MSKTPTEVLEDISTNAFQVLSRDDKTGLAKLILAKLDAAGFVIVPKEPNKNITTALVLAYGSAGSDKWMSKAECFRMGLAGNAETEWMAGAWRAAVAVANEPVTDGERDSVTTYERVLASRATER